MTTRTLAADSFNPAAWASAGEERLKHSADGNVSWQSINSSEFHTLVVLEPNLLIGAAGWPPGTASVQLSVDGGATWFAIGEATMYGLADGNNAQSLSVVFQ